MLLRDAARDGRLEDEDENTARDGASDRIVADPAFPLPPQMNPERRARASALVT